MAMGLPRTKIVAVRIFKSLLSKDIPFEILNKAVDKSMINDTRVQEVMNLKSKVDLGANHFFKLIFNLLLETKQYYWSSKSQNFDGNHAYSSELARLFSQVLLSENSDDQWCKVKETLFGALTKLNELDEAEIETVMSIFPVTCHDQLQKGSIVVNQNGQKMTILGFDNDT